MNRLTQFLAAALPLLTLSLTASPCASFTVDFPPGRTIVNNETVTFVISKGNSRIDAIRVIDSNHKPSETVVSPDSSSACFQVALNHGLNNIELHAILDKQVVERSLLQLYLKSDLHPGFQAPPAGFSPYTFHTSDNEKHCAGCHNMEPTLTDLSPLTPEASPCFTCHSATSTNVFVHYPTRRWQCLFCHQVQGKKPKYSTESKDRDNCFACHSSQIKEWEKKHIVHGPTATGKCTLCHNPHGSGKPALLRMQTTDLCIKCHADKASGAHVIAGFYGKGHPVRGVKNPLQPDREFTCAGCHDPHAGDTLNLLRHNNKKMTEYCILCHEL